LTQSRYISNLDILTETIMDFIKDLGYLAVATRMKRLTERLMKGAGEVYKSLGIDFEPRYFAVFYLLSQSKEPLSISEIAAGLKISHPAVIQTTQLLLKKKLIISAQDKIDRRKRLLTLSKKGMRMAEDMRPIWDDFVKATVDLFESTEVDILDTYQKIEDALDENEISERILKRIKTRLYSSYNIVEYRSEYKEDFKRLNENWLRKHFELEDRDIQVLKDPEGEILDKGGFVLFALSGDKVIGTAALFRSGKKTYELSKMAVDPSFQKRQVGRRLVDAVVQKARAGGAESIVLWTDDRLYSAVSLYKSVGFEKIKPSEEVPVPYKRAQCGIMMQLSL
jgi:GNAT superfamily N-acetyltransferase